MAFALASNRTSRSVCVSPLVAFRTPLKSRNHVSWETNVPIMGEYPGRGPRISSPIVSVLAADASSGETAAGGGVAAVRPIKLLRVASLAAEGAGWLFTLSPQGNNLARSVCGRGAQYTFL